MEKGQKTDKIIIKDSSGQGRQTLSPMDFYEREVLRKETKPKTTVRTKKRKKPLKPLQRFWLLLLALLAITAVATAVAVFAGGDGAGVNSEHSGQSIFPSAGDDNTPGIPDGSADADGTGGGSVSAYGPNAYDSADTAVLVSRSGKESTMTFLNLDAGRTYTLFVDGATKFYDKYGTVLSAEQVSNGAVVDITFLKEEKHLTSLQLAASAWSYEEVEKYEIDPEKNQISIGSDEYKLTSETLFFSENNQIELMDLNPADILSFQGIGKQILSVTVEKGHGYLRLKNDENFIGGWIEVGQSMICKITEDMLLAVPEGTFEISVSYRGGGGRKTATIYRDEETTLDVGDLEIPAPKSGQVLFSVSPADAEIYIDGTLIDASAPVNLLYGLHQLIARADGYQSITQYIRVAQPTAGINVTLDLAGSGGETSEASEQETTTDYYKVYIDAPVGAEVYVDGNYIGIAPCSFKKEEGSYVIILRKSGYETKSYTVSIDDSEKDLSYSFADLVENP